MGVPTPQFSASATGRLVVYQGAMLVHVDAANARTTLELGTAALQNTGTSGANVPLLNGANTWSGRQIFSASVTGNSGMATATGNLGEAEVRGNGTGAAMMAFHRPGAFAGYFGIDTDSQLKVGGWSAGANAYKIFHAGMTGSAVFPGAVSISSTTASTSTTTGALTVVGGIGAQGDAFFGRAVWANGANAQFVAEASSGNPRVLFNRVGVTKAYLDSNAGSFNVNSDATGTVGMFMIYSGSAWTAFSDARLPYKKTARPVTVLDKLDSIALYENEVNGRTELFVKAQEFHKAFPQLVKVGSDDPDYEPKGMADPESWGVSYERAGVAALQGLKELRAIVAVLEDQIKGKKRSNG
jgi:hypothetical protein